MPFDFVLQAAILLSDASLLVRQAVAHEFLAIVALLVARVLVAGLHPLLLRSWRQTSASPRQQTLPASSKPEFSSEEHLQIGLTGFVVCLALRPRPSARARRVEGSLRQRETREATNSLTVHERLLRAAHLAPQQTMRDNWCANRRRMCPIAMNFREKGHAMILVLEPNTSPDGTEYQVPDRAARAASEYQYRVHREVGSRGDADRDLPDRQHRRADASEQMQVLPCVQKVVRVSEAYRVLGRHKQGDDRPSSFDYNGVHFGQDTLQRLRRACAPSIRRESVEAMMKALQAHGQVCTRMGAYKPRTSPYAFQGFGAKVPAVRVRARRQVRHPA